MSRKAARSGHPCPKAPCQSSKEAFASLNLISLKGRGAGLSLALPFTLSSTLPFFWETNGAVFVSGQFAAAGGGRYGAGGMTVSPPSAPVSPAPHSPPLASGARSSVGGMLPVLVAMTGLACFSVMDGVMKAAAIVLGAFATIFWRSVIGSMLMAPWWARETVRKRGGRLPPRAIMGLHVLRAGLTAGMSTLYFDGVVRMPLAQAMALSFVAPLIALYLAALTLGERLRPRAVVGSLVALAGVGVIAADELGHAPGGDGWRGLIEILVSAVLYAFTLVLQRRQAQVATPVEVAFFQSILVALILLPLALVWAPWPAPFAWGLVALGAVLAVASMMLLAWAYARAEAQVLVPLEYTAFIWAALVGWLAFAEPLTRGTLGGVVLIVAGCVFATRRGSGEGTKAPGPTALEGM